MTSSPHGPYAQGCTHATLRATEGCDPARGSESQKGAPGSDWGLQLDPMKSESLVIADQQRCGEYVPGPCTHRPSHHESGQHPKPVAQPAREGAVEGGVRDWGEVVSKLRPPLATVGEKLGCMLETPHVSRATSRRCRP
jgi:hypothetical protein